MAVRKRSPHFLLFLLSCVLFLPPSFALANDRPKILILNSYHQIYFWTDSIMQGIREVFAEQGQTVDFYVENMDSKRFFDGRKEEYVAHLRELYRDKYAGLRLACIISSDDDALNFLLACRHELFPGVPIVFCGVNNFTDDLLAGQAGITGVIETLDRKETIDIALALHPGAKRIALVTDTATTGRGNRSQLEMLARQYAPAVDFVFLDPDGEGLAYDELLGKVKALPRDAIIFYSDFHLDKSGRAFDDQRLVAAQLHQASGLPAYTNYASVFGPGTVGGKLNDPLFQGRTAAEMAVRILKGESIATIPVTKKAPNRFMFQDSQLRNFQIPDKKLPPDSIIVNRPVTFYQQHKGKVWFTVFLLALQSVIISFLLHTIRQRREAEENATLANEKLHTETKRYAAELEQRVKTRTMELVRANEKLRELDRLKSMFIASMSHELRTPLNSIIGFSSILREEWLGPANAEQKENLAAILAAGKHLLSLINDIIDLSKIEAGMLASEAETFDLRELITEVVGAIKKDARDKGVEITADVAPLMLRTDRRRLLQCLLNLLGNAVKFTEAGAISVTVRQEDDDNDGRMLAIAVRDTGIGIRAADLDRLFEPFVRLHPPGDIRYPGTGLGLHLTAKLVREVLGGGIAVTSEFGRGSTFTIRIPAGSAGGEGQTSTQDCLSGP